MTLDSQLADIGVAAERIDAFAAEHQLSAAVCHDVQLAVEEILTNVIKHGYRGEAGHAIGLEVAVRQGEVVIWVEDAAPAFNPLQAAAPNLNLPLAQKQPGGLGIHLVRKVMDSLDYERAGGKNRLTLKKRL
jgi:anti-sigma regulatory factor (Ser/Thr protein kinase)